METRAKKHFQPFFFFLKKDTTSSLMEQYEKAKQLEAKEEA